MCGPLLQWAWVKSPPSSFLVRDSTMLGEFDMDVKQFLVTSVGMHGGGYFACAMPWDLQIDRAQTFGTSVWFGSHLSKC